MGYY